MRDNQAICLDCPTRSDGTTVTKVTSDASWHNTMTGHDVMVLDEDGDRWSLTDDGWKREDE